MQELVTQLVQYLRGIWHRRWIGLAVAWLVAIVGALIIFRLPDKYEASARVYVDTQSLLQPLMVGMAVNTNPSQQVSLLSRILLSRPNLEKIIRKADLDTSAGTSAAALVDDTAGSLRIARATGDNLYTIAFQYADRSKARDVVQAALSIFIEQSMGENRSGTESARRFIDQQIQDYESKLRDSENRLQAFRLKYMSLLGTSGRDYLQQMSALEEQIKDTRIELKVAEQTRDGIRRQLDEQTDSHEAPRKPTVAPHIAVPELDTRIDALKGQRDELLRKYTEQHPDIVSIKRLLTQLEDERDRKVDALREIAAREPKPSADSGNPVTQQLKVALNEAESSVVAVRARLSEYQARLGQLASAADAVPKVETERTQLDRDYGILKRQYESLVSRRETANLTGKLEDAGVAEFRIIDPPRVTPTPVAPNRILLLWGLLAGALGAGVATSFLVSQVRPTFHDGRALGDVVQRPLLGTVGMVPSPGLHKKRVRSALVFTGALSGFFVLNAAALVVTYFISRVQ